ncbi:MAG: DEAD/DEAH box helicase [Acidobacteriaceae bacterium]
METTDIYGYLRAHASELGSRILESYPPLQSMTDEVPAELSALLRTPLPAQAIAIGGLSKHLKHVRAARIVAECGAGKTYMALGLAHVLQARTILVMCPSHIAKKWAREAIQTIPFVRTFLVEDMRNGGDPRQPHGVLEVRLRKGRVVYEGMQLSLPELRRLGRAGWVDRVPRCSVFIIPKDKGKLSYFWRHAFLTAKCGPDLGGVINPDTGVSIENSDGGRLTRLDFDNLKISEEVEHPSGGTTMFSPLWQADGKKIQRMAPVEFIGRYMKGWFDLAIADELHQLAGDTAQGNALGVLARAGRRLVALTGTLMGGYADDLFNVFYRMEPHMMASDGFAYGGEGRRSFQEQYGVLETIEKIREEDNACTRAPKKTVQVLRKPGASPLLFGKFLMSTTAFLALEDIADNLPPYTESVLSCEMSGELREAYEELEKALRSAMAENRGNKSLMSVLLNALLLYPDHPYGFDEIWARAFDPATKEYYKFLVARPKELLQDVAYPKESSLIEDVQSELRQGRRCQVYATYTGEKDVNGRLEQILSAAGLRVAVLRSSVPTQKREEWYDRQLESGVEVVVCHPKLVETGLDLLAFPTLYFYQTGYSLHTLRQASRRSWRIGQRHPVRVKFLTYKGTMQEVCLRLMGRKMLVALMMEGKFSGEGLQSLDADEDLMSAMARELVEKAGVGESADQVWRQLDRQRSKQMGPSPHEVAKDVDDGALIPTDAPELGGERSIHLVPPVREKKRPDAPSWPATATGDQPIQLSLFG